MRTHSAFLPFKRLIHLKGIVHPNIVLNKKYILKNVDDQTVLDPIHLHCIFFNGGRQSMGTEIFCVSTQCI